MAKLSSWYGITVRQYQLRTHTTLTIVVGTLIAKSQKMRIELVPHVHSLKNCNRKFVCDTPGTYRERERVRYCSSGEDNLLAPTTLLGYGGKCRKYDSSIAWEECKLGEDDSQQTCH